MANNNAVVLSAANLNIIENNIGQLAKNVGDINTNVNVVDNKVNEVTASVKTIEDEIRNFMVEIRGSTIVANAKQSIMMSQDELNKEYGHYDNVRRKINGLFQAADINAIRKSTIEGISEQVIIDTPNYWLAPALVSLCAWLTNNKDLANRALKEAMNRDDEKTSLLFCLIHLRANRSETALRWLNRYLEMQDPSQMENKIITILDAVTSGALGLDAQNLCLNNIERWFKELKNLPSYAEIQIDRWTTYLNSQIIKENQYTFNYIQKYTDSYDHIHDLIIRSNSHKQILTNLKAIINQEQKTTSSKTMLLDKLINMLVFNYENEELDLKKDIAKNRLIIEENGNVSRANERFKETEFAFQKNTDFYSQLTNIVLEYKSTKPTINTRKMALALSKDWLKQAYQKNMSDDFSTSFNINIQIGTWTGTTTNGQNEQELIDSLNQHIDAENHHDIYGKSIIDLKMVVASLLGLILIVIFSKQVLISAIILICVLIFDIYSFIINLSQQKNKIKKCNQQKQAAQAILMNTLAEIVDYYFINQDNKKYQDQIISFIDNLDYHNYINKKN